MDMGSSAPVQRAEVDLVEIWEFCDKERKSAVLVCSRARDEFIKKAEELCSKDSLRIYNNLELEELINKVGTLAYEYITLIKGVVEKRECVFSEMISSVYMGGSNEKIDFILKSFSEVSTLFNEIIEFEINQKDLEHKIALGTCLKSKISSQRSVKEEKNQVKAEQLMKVNQFLRKAQVRKNFIDEKLVYITAYKPKVEVSKIYIDRLETQMNVAVMNASDYPQKIEVAEGNLVKAERVLSQSVIKLTNKSETLNSLVEKYFAMKEAKGGDKDQPIITEGEVIAAIYEFEKASNLVGRADGLCYSVEKDLENLNNIAKLKSKSNDYM